MKKTNHLLSLLLAICISFCPGAVRADEPSSRDDAATAFRIFESYRENDPDRAHLFLRLAILRSNDESSYVERYRDSIIEHGCRPQDCVEFAGVIQQLLMKAPVERVETYLSYVEELENKMSDVDESPNSESETFDPPVLPPLDVRSIFDPDNGERILEKRRQLAMDIDEIDEKELERCRAVLSLHELFMTCRENLSRAESAILKTSPDELSVDELFDRLTSQEIVAPLAGAQQQIAAMFLFPNDLFDDNERVFILESIRNQESLLSKIGQKADEVRFAAIREELKRKDASIENSSAPLTKQIEMLKMQVEFIAGLLPSIGAPTIARQVLSEQNDRVERLQKIMKQRHVEYQKWAMGELKKAIAAQDLDKKDGSGKFEKAKSAMIDYLSRIDRACLVPEVNEIYQDVYRRASETISNHLEDKGRRKEKADFLFDFYTKPKKSLEDF